MRMRSEISLFLLPQNKEKQNNPTLMNIPIKEPWNSGPVAAVIAMYYSEGALRPKGYPNVSHYKKRVTQVFVKEDGSWKVRASHWPPVQGGSGTSQTAME